MYEESVDIDKEILYWIDCFGFEVVNCKKLIEYVKENYIRNGEDVIREYMEVMEWKVDIEYLDQKKICEANDDYEYLGNDLYLNIYRLENDDIELKRLDLIA